MLEILGLRQKELLKLLLKNKSGLTADELAQQLAITRTAVRQHLAALENDRLVEKGETRPSGGRPQQLYVLSDKGQECFPRQYSWFAQLLVDSVQQETGADGLGQRLGAMGAKVASQLRAQHPQLTTPQEKVQMLATIMEQMGYNTKTIIGPTGTPVIEADNCVFHHLAVQNPEICRFDLSLLENFTDSKVDHQQCMARSDHICRFKFKNPD
jgi:predicted ArsR family transcriptional regulator